MAEAIAAIMKGFFLPFQKGSLCPTRWEDFSGRKRLTKPIVTCDRGIEGIYGRWNPESETASGYYRFELLEIGGGVE
jgi:hypothetical protein